MQRADNSNDRSSSTSSYPSTLSCCILDDELPIIKTITSRAAAKRMRVTVCPSLNHLLLQIVDEVPHVIFLDVALNETDAVEIMRVLGSTSFRGTVHLMGRRQEELMDRLIEIGTARGLNMGAYVKKPFRRKEIDFLLDQFLAGTDSLSRYQPPVRPAPMEPAILSEKLSQSLNNNAITFFYRPRFDLETGRLIGAHLLPTDARTGEFFDIRQEPEVPNQNIDRLSALGLEAALTGWERLSTPDFSPLISLRVPLASLKRLPLGRIIRNNRPASTNWPGITIEIAERDITRHLRAMREIAAQLNIHGVHTSIFDFGDGDLALRDLGRFHPDQIVINPDLIQHCSKCDFHAQMCNSIILLAKSLGARTVAAGVENRADLDALAAMGCNFAYGKALAPEMSADDFKDFIARGYEVAMSHPKISGLDYLRQSERLSQREVEVLELIASGKSSKEIGQELGLSPRTIDVHRTRLMAKLQARNVAELVKLALTSHA